LKKYSFKIKNGEVLELKSKEHFPGNIPSAVMLNVLEPYGPCNTVGHCFFFETRGKVLP
jgi:hypothetical protein